MTAPTYPHSLRARARIGLVERAYLRGSVHRRRHRLADRLEFFLVREAVQHEPVELVRRELVEHAFPSGIVIVRAEQQTELGGYRLTFLALALRLVTVEMTRKVAYNS